MERRRPLAAALVTAVAAWAGLTGCTDGAADAPPGSDRDVVAPLTDSMTPDPPSPSSGSSATPSSPRGARSTAGSGPDADGVDPPMSDGGVPPSADAGERRRARLVATELLDRYGRVLTALAADPALDLGRFATSWVEVADPGSAFSRDMLQTLVARVRDDRMIVVPGPDGRSYMHRPMEITAADDDAIEFTWCGFSPGIGIHVETRAVLDDAVGHASGTGRLVRAGDRWLVDALDQEQLVALPPGTPDPCAGRGAR